MMCVINYKRIGALFILVVVVRGFVIFMVPGGIVIPLVISADHCILGWPCGSPVLFLVVTWQLHG